ncbi:MAG: site-specific integrase [Fusobacteriaceae bacterium]|jgi:integrase/recombinase XerD|nr:site-specific integrase [Fusobacteriaceae bacterium]
MDSIWKFLEYARNIGNINDKTFRIYEKDINDLRVWLKGRELLMEQANTADLAEYFGMLKKKYKTKTVYRKISSIRNFYKYLLEKKVIDKIPMGSYNFEPVPLSDEHFLTREEFDLLLSQFPDTEEGLREKILTELIYETSLKNTELFTLEMRDLRRYEYKSILFLKKGQFSTKDLPSALEQEIRRYAALYPQGNLFDRKYQKIFGGHLTEYGVQAGFQNKITGSLLRNSKMLNQRKETEGDGSFFQKLKECYMAIGIGDDPQ